MIRSWEELQQGGTYLANGSSQDNRWLLGSEEESTLLVDNIDGDNDGQGDRLVDPVAMYFHIHKMFDYWFNEGVRPGLLSDNGLLLQR